MRIQSTLRGCGPMRRPAPACPLQRVVRMHQGPICYVATVRGSGSTQQPMDADATQPPQPAQPESGMQSVASSVPRTPAPAASPQLMEASTDPLPQTSQPVASMQPPSSPGPVSPLPPTPQPKPQPVAQSQPAASEAKTTSPPSQLMEILHEDEIALESSFEEEEREKARRRSRPLVPTIDPQQLAEVFLGPAVPKAGGELERLFQMKDNMGA